MLQIKTTPNLYGITLMGDYLDLDALYDSLSRYLAFYQDNMSQFQPYHEYEYLLSLNYDIRHAYQGDRGTEIMENNAEAVGMMAENIYEISPAAKKEFRDIRKNFSKGNLYFSVEILYPLVFHYMISLENILDDEPMEYWFRDEQEREEEWMNNYSRLDAEYDRAKIREFIMLLWTNVQSLLGRDEAMKIYNYFFEVELSFTGSIYIDALIHCQLAFFPHLTRLERLSFLKTSLYEIIDSQDLLENPEEFAYCAQSYSKAVTALAKAGESKKGKRLFPTKTNFYQLIDRLVPSGRALYEDEFDEMLENEYGKIVDEDPEM